MANEAVVTVVIGRLNVCFTVHVHIQYVFSAFAGPSL